ncbi:purine-nucleoside phosphorylase [Paenibacillus ginsengarvi]|uniref:Purine nucleoside phosphorylase n=1 Tax=Paenibacillus ginsengarvi TaxID=400777 RepID=A0A3B0CFB7_9BACL|nr:purine-nucleoside phosphorylase [Paenibacillus ginsengarvi]RKN84655.1 purine-nucleoside phosphorylase [Paenibacillus ginsengarvi]
MELSYVEQINQAAAYIRARIGGKLPVLGLVLGSGLGDLAEQVEQADIIPFADVPHFPVSTVEGHAGRFVIGTLEGKTVLVMQGRFHYYEGYAMRKVVAPIYVMQKLGIRAVVITNAAGGMNRAFRPGDLMLICDHINMTGDHPLIGPNEATLGPRFPDMSEAYNKSFRELAHRLSSQIRSDEGDSLELQEGVYCGISGPSYMTPAELKMLAILGGDAVGMSTVAEVIAARHCGMNVLGISCITDMAIGEELEPLTHEQVMEVANRTKPKFAALVKSFVREVNV